MTIQAHILVVDDDQQDNERYCLILRGAGYAVQSVTDAEQALAVIRQQIFDVVLLDMLLPMQLRGRLDFGGMEVLRQIKHQHTATQVIAVTGYGSRELAAEAMAEGALDYITKDIDTEERLPGSVRIAITRAQHLRGTQSSDDQSGGITLTTPEHVIADSSAMRQVLRRAQRLADIDGPLLILGEPGVGKELLANIIHINSRYAAGSFVRVMCRTLSSDLAELWGRAEAPETGLCAQAAGGTLVLRDIQELPLRQQRQIVSFIEQKVYQPIGAMAPVQANIRVIATAAPDLERRVRQGRFVRPLYDELNVATLDVPPLRERRDKDDIMAIAGYLLHRYGLAPGIAADAAELLVAHDYREANIKELEEILRDAAMQSNGNVIQASHLPSRLYATTDPETPAESSAAVALSADTDGIGLSVRFVPGDPAILIWESQSGGSTRSHFQLPFAEPDLPLILRALDAVQWPGHPQVGPQFSSSEQQKLTALELWNGTRVAEDVDQRIGQQLYTAMLADPSARSALDSARNIAIEQGQHLALTLRFPDDAITLAAIPWELLWDDHQPVLLSRGQLSSCVRYMDLPQGLPIAPSREQKLRLLAVGPSAGIPESLHVEEHNIRRTGLQQLMDAGILVMEELYPATIDSLTDRLQDGAPVDILHFYGHGIWQDGLAHLAFDDGLLNANQLASLFKNIPLVVLFACRSATVGTDDLFTGIAPMLSTQGIPAVVAMQFTVPVTAANRFASRLYTNLANGESLQTAVAKARQALYMKHRASWYVPVLYIRSRDPRPIMFIQKH
jgi:DNA-binding NtrC family response regulator